RRSTGLATRVQSTYQQLALAISGSHDHAWLTTEIHHLSRLHPGPRVDGITDYDIAPRSWLRKTNTLGSSFAGRTQINSIPIGYHLFCIGFYAATVDVDTIFRT